ncbi:DUF6183 family protein [Streptosporangium sp. DT93]|uniref:DUF6183 family protein n=1 Tax=Streptosporangium sp. DT93 TaxID=3393428 RepID=UPI003CFADA9D
MSAYRIGDEPHAAVLAAVPGDAAAPAELVRGRYTGARGVRDVRDLAALLAESLPVHRLLPLFGHPPSGPDMWAELIACLTQELVVRGGAAARRRGDGMVGARIGARR